MRGKILLGLVFVEKLRFFGEAIAVVLERLKIKYVLVGVWLGMHALEIKVLRCESKLHWD